MFYGAMRPYGVETVATMEPTEAWLASGEADVIHLHWPDSLWRRHRKGWLQRLAGVRNVASFLTAARAAGVRIVWTVHNLGAHEGGDWIDHLGYRAFVRRTDLVICHSRWSAERVARMYRPGGRVVVMPHGNLIGYMPRAEPRESVVASFGLNPELPLVSCLGYLRAYKGLELVCAAVAKLRGRVQLVIAGPPFRKYDLAPLRAAVASLPHALLIERRLSDQEYADLTAASDASVLAYTNVTTSQVLLASWSAGTGVIASDLPPFRELLPASSSAGALFRPGDADDLARVIDRYLTLPRADCQQGALAEARKYEWARCVTPVAEWLEQQREPGAARVPAAGAVR
jgi:glycosyltransferase involved in cell wall biosynthesis